MRPASGEKDRNLLLSIQNFFGGIGNISKVSATNSASTVEFRFNILKELVNVILPHFDNYPLISKKHSDYLLFKQVVLLMANKEQSNLEGIRKVVSLKSYINLGLSAELKEAFPDIASSPTLGAILEPEENKIINKNIHRE